MKKKAIYLLSVLLIFSMFMLGGGLFLNKQPAKADVTYYMITYNLGGGSNRVNNRARYAAADDTFKIYEPVRNGYIFNGWQEVAGWKEGDVTEIVTGSAGNKTFTAKWLTKEQYDAIAEVKSYEVYVGYYNSPANNNLARKTIDDAVAAITGAPDKTYSGSQSTWPAQITQAINNAKINALDVFDNLRAYFTINGTELANFKTLRKNELNAYLSLNYYKDFNAENNPFSENDLDGVDILGTDTELDAAVKIGIKNIYAGATLSFNQIYKAFLDAKSLILKLEKDIEKYRTYVAGEMEVFYNGLSLETVQQDAAEIIYYHYLGLINETPNVNDIDAYYNECISKLDVIPIKLIVGDNMDAFENWLAGTESEVITGGNAAAGYVVGNKAYIDAPYDIVTNAADIYRPEEQAVFNAAVEKGRKDIEEAISDIAGKLDFARNAVSGILTDAQLTLAEEKVKAIAKIEGYYKNYYGDYVGEYVEKAGELSAKLSSAKGIVNAFWKLAELPSGNAYDLTANFANFTTGLKDVKSDVELLRERLNDPVFNSQSQKISDGEIGDFKNTLKCNLDIVMLSDIQAAKTAIGDLCRDYLTDNLKKGEIPKGLTNYEASKGSDEKNAAITAINAKKNEIIAKMLEWEGDFYKGLVDNYLLGKIYTDSGNNAKTGEFSYIYDVLYEDLILGLYSQSTANGIKNAYDYAIKKIDEIPTDLLAVKNKNVIALLQYKDSIYNYFDKNELFILNLKIVSAIDAINSAKSTTDADNALIYGIAAIDQVKKNLTKVREDKISELKNVIPNLNVYRPAEQAQINNIIKEYTDLINKTPDPNSIIKIIFENGKAALLAVKTNRALSIEELQAYVNKILIYYTDEDTIAVINEIKDQAIADLKTCAEKDVSSIFNAAVISLCLLPTDAALDKINELTDAFEALDLKEEDYREEQAAEINGLLMKATAEIILINLSDPAAEIIFDINAVINAIKAVKTNKELTTEELIAEFNKLDSEDYRIEEYAEIVSIKNAAVTAINGLDPDDADGIKAAYDKALADMDAVPTAEEYDLWKAKKDKKQELEDFLLSNEIFKTNYFDEQWNQIEAFVNSEKAKIDALNTVEAASGYEFDIATLDGDLFIKGVKILNKDRFFAKFKTDKLEELGKYVNSDKYRPDDKTKVNKLANDAIGEIIAITEKSEDSLKNIASKYDKAIGDIKNIPTAAELDAKELADAKKAKIKELNDYVENLNQNDYTAINWAKIEDYVKNYTTEINDAHSVVSVEGIFIDARAAIREVDTKDYSSFIILMVLILIVIITVITVILIVIMRNKKKLAKNG